MSRTPSTSASAYPLDWPEGQPQTSSLNRRRAKFKTSFGQARTDLLHELRLLGVGDWNVVISSNVQLRRDGLPYAGRKPHGSPGIAVYYWLDEEPQVIACDVWDRVEDNLRAIGKTVEALRGIERWGSGDLMRRAFSGFKALPPSAEDWKSVLGVEGATTLGDVKQRYRSLAAQAHPDRGGSEHEMQRLNAVYEAAREALQ